MGDPVSFLTVLLEASSLGLVVLKSDTGKRYVRCPFTLAHADVAVKLAVVTRAPDQPDTDVLDCEICGRKTARDVMGVMQFDTIARALNRWDEVCRTATDAAEGAGADG